MLQIAAATYAPVPVTSLCSADIQALRDEQEVFNRSENMVEGVVLENPTNHFSIVGAVGTTASTFDANSASDSDSDSGSSSGEESDVPITPESHAQDSRVLVEVPDMPEGEDMGIAALPVVEVKNKLPVESLLQRMERFAL